MYSTDKFDVLENFIIPDSIHQGIGKIGKEGGSVKFVNIQNLTPYGTINFSNIKFVDDVPDARLLPAGTVLLSRSRLVGVCSTIPRDCGNITCGSYILNFQLNKNKMLPTFLAKFINSSFGQQQIKYLQTGASGSNINISQVKKIMVIKISTMQQLAIVDAVNQIENVAKQKERDARNELNKIDMLLTQAVNTSFRQTRKQHYASYLPSDNKRLDFIFNDPFYRECEEIMENSTHQFKELGSIVTFTNDSINPLKQPNESFRYVDIGSIDTLWGTICYRTMSGHEATSSRMRKRMHKNQILVSTTRPTRGAIAIIPNNLDKQVCSTGFASLSCNKNVKIKYLFYLLRSSIVKTQLFRYSSGSEYPEINKDVDLPKIKVPILDVDAQNELVKKIDNIVCSTKKQFNEASNEYKLARAEFERYIMTLINPI